MFQDHMTHDNLVTLIDEDGPATRITEAMADRLVATGIAVRDGASVREIPFSARQLVARHARDANTFAMVDSCDWDQTPMVPERHLHLIVCEND